jgi:hypothetical protein
LSAIFRWRGVERWWGPGLRCRVFLTTDTDNDRFFNSTLVHLPLHHTHYALPPPPSASRSRRDLPPRRQPQGPDLPVSRLTSARPTRRAAFLTGRDGTTADFGHPVLHPPPSIPRQRVSSRPVRITSPSAFRRTCGDASWRRASSLFSCLSRAWTTTNTSPPTPPSPDHLAPSIGVLTPATASGRPRACTTTPPSELHGLS